MMRFVNSILIRTRQIALGQTMTEYALILAAVAIVVYATYQVMGNDISILVNTIDSAPHQRLLIRPLTQLWWTTPKLSCFT